MGSFESKEDGLDVDRAMTWSTGVDKHLYVHEQDLHQVPSIQKLKASKGMPSRSRDIVLPLVGQNVRRSSD